MSGETVTIFGAKDGFLAFHLTQAGNKWVAEKFAAAIEARR